MKKYLFSAAGALLAFCGASQAATAIGPWTPLFKGIDYSVSTNTPGGTLPRLQVVHALRVDLSDPDIHFETTPRVDTNYLSGTREVIGVTVSDFLVSHNVQAAINANFFSPTEYYPPPGTYMDLHGLAINQGTNVSAANSTFAAALTFSVSNHCTFIPVNWPAQPTTGVFTAVSGDTALVINGVNRMTQDADAQPRTVYGVSKDRRYLYLLAIDGRQPGYSDGATFYECARWLLLLGANDGLNLDGGGSTTLVVEDSTGVPVRLNSSSAVADSGHERTVGSHFGIHAKPLPGFINDVQAIPEDTSAVIQWTTIEQSTSAVQYGLTSTFELGQISSDQLTNIHSVSLTGLTPSTQYYFQVLSATASQQYASSNFVFTTTNYVTTNLLFDFNQPWKFSYASLDGVNWTAPTFDDSAWQGPGPGVLWADTRTTPNPAIQDKMTQMPGDPTTGFPYVTYYFRTSFVLSNVVAGSSLSFSGFVDDGAAFYLNGVNIYLLRLTDSATSSTLASGFPCSGDADCLDKFVVPPEAITNLIVGTNVLAAEVHNYNARSPDITFGVALSIVQPIQRDITLQIGWSAGKVSLNWSSPAVLQSAPAIDGPWTDVTPVPSNPAILQPSGTLLFYRLRQ